MLITYNFCFSRNVSTIYLKRERNATFRVTFEFSSANAFSLDKARIRSSGKVLTHDNRIKGSQQTHGYCPLSP